MYRPRRRYYRSPRNDRNRFVVVVAVVCCVAGVGVGGVAATVAVDSAEAVGDADPDADADPADAEANPVAVPGGCGGADAGSYAPRELKDNTTLWKASPVSVSQK